MAAADIAINIAAQFTGKTAFDKAENSAAKLQKSVKNLGRSLGLALGATAIANFGKQSVKAFAADEKAARSLSLALANTGNAFAAMDVESFIQNLQRTTGVLDDELRPAFRTLITATGDVKKSQDALSLALDISRGTGKDLSAVTLALSKGFSGQTTALSRLGAGLSKATLASGDMDLITSELQKKFAGQALEATKGFSGQMDLLTVSVNNAKEAIGKGLVDALAILSGGGGVGGATGVIDKIASGIADGAKNIAFMIKQFEALKPVIIAIGALLLIYFAPITAAVAALAYLLSKGGANLKQSQFAAGKVPGGMGNVSMTGGSSQDTQKAQVAAKKKADAESVKLLKSKNTLSKIDNSNTERKLTLTGDQLALLELEKKFDVERIGLFAAMNQATDGETKMRLLSLLAIKDQNAALAGQITVANKSADALEAFRQAVLAALAALIAKVKDAQAAILGTTPTGGYSAADVNTQSIAAASLSQGLSAGLSLPDALSGARYAAQGAANYVVSVNVAGSVTTERDLVSAITQGIVNNQASGIPISYSTTYK
jgi:hypothetical protein